ELFRRAEGVGAGLRKNEAVVSEVRHQTRHRAEVVGRPDLVHNNGQVLAEISHLVSLALAVPRGAGIFGGQCGSSASSSPWGVRLPLPGAGVRRPRLACRPCVGCSPMTRSVWSSKPNLF